MRYTIGIDLGSTTTKAIVLDEDGAVLGRGITNSRSNYDLAAAVARTEGFINARFGLIQQRLEATGEADAVGRRQIAVSVGVPAYGGGGGGLRVIELKLDGCLLASERLL